MNDIPKESIKNRSLENLESLLTDVRKEMAENTQRPANAKCWKSIEIKTSLAREIELRSLRAEAATPKS